ncbi:MAG: hypothetical protein ACRD0J_18180 [Acidimicrobiales bacterium]
MILGVILGAGFLAWSLWWIPLVHGAPVWIVNQDTWVLTLPARYVANGAFPFLYQGNPWLFALPLMPVLLAPAVALGDALHLSQGYPLLLAHPTMWLVFEPVVAIAGVVVLHAGRRLMWELGLRKRLWLAQAVLAVMAVLPCLLWSHPEDLLALAGVLYALRLMIRHQWSRAAFVIGLAICAKQWAVLALPFILLRAPEGERLRTGLVSVAIPLGMAAAPLALDWNHAFPALLAQTTPPPNVFWHSSLLQSLGQHASRLSRLLVLAAAPVLTVATRRSRVPVLLVSLGAVLLVRPLLEPVVLPYYFGPGLALVMVGMIAQAGHIRPRELAAICLPALWAIPTSGSNDWWWVGEALALLVMASVVARRFRRSAGALAC